MNKCQISWIDSRGLPTPDDHTAIGRVKLNARTEQIAGRGVSFPASQWFHVCECHARQLTDPGMHIWEFEYDNEQAASEGWAVSECHGSENGPWQLQKLDHMDRFAKDSDAWSFVAKQADSGSEYHQNALSFLAHHNPIEHRVIVDFLRLQASASVAVAKSQAIETFTKLVSQYGLQWTKDVPAGAWQEMQKCNEILTSDDRRRALGLRN